MSSRYAPESAQVVDAATLYRHGPWKCPTANCGALSTKCYRCSECGHDFAGNQQTAGRQDMNTK